MSSSRLSSASRRLLARAATVAAWETAAPARCRAMNLAGLESKWMFHPAALATAGRGLASVALGCNTGLSSLYQPSQLVQGVQLQPRVRFMSSVPPYEELSMPSLSPTMTQGNIVKWLKKEGDTVAPGDVLCEVETDKATIEWEAQEEGILAKILVPEGSKDVPCGTLVAIIAEEDTDISAFANFTPGAQLPPAAPAASSSTPEPAAPAAPASPASSYPSHMKLEMPSLSPTMEQGNIQEWKKQVGDSVSAGEALAIIETDKATMDWESQEDGFLAKILMPAGSENISVGTLVAVMVDDKEDIAAFSDFTGEAAAASPPPPSAPSSAPAAPSATSAAAPKKPAVVAGDGKRIIASPLAKSKAAEAGVSLQGLAGTGPGGRIIAADVDQLIASGGGKGAPVAAASGVMDFSGMPPYEDIPAGQIQKITAARLLESKQTIPHYYLSVDCKVDDMMVLRAQLNKSLEKEGVKISVNDLIIKAAAAALIKVPEVNASWQGDFVRQYKGVDMSIAVQTEHGLMVPIVKGADRKGLAAISAEVQRLAAKAKEGKLAPAEFMGGTFTISNLGMFGIKTFSAIVNPPQACILAVGGADKRVALGADGQFVEQTVVNVTLSCDHRVIDGAMGATWLKTFKGFLENPLTLML